MRYTRLAVAGLALALAAGSTASAQNAINVTAGPTEATLGNPPFTLGWSFDVLSDVFVTHLGVWDTGGDGLAEAHDVGIWNSGGTLLGSATVPSATGGFYDDGFRWIAVGQFQLTAGTNYRIGALYTNSGGADPLLWDATVTNSAAIDYGSSAFCSGASLCDPATGSGLDGAYIGPNFQVSAVPEPGTYALMATGLVGLAGVVRRRRNIA